MNSSIVTEDGFMQMYDCFYGKIYNYLYFRLLNRENTEDLMCEVFLKAFTYRTSYDERKSKLSTWLFTIAKNTLVDYCRKNGRMTLLELSSLTETITDGVDVENAYIKSVEQELALRSLRQLRERDRAVIYLKYFMGFNYREIGGHLNVTPKNASVLLTRAMRRLREIYDREEIGNASKHIPEKLIGKNVVSGTAK